MGYRGWCGDRHPCCSPRPANGGVGCRIRQGAAALIPERADDAAIHKFMVAHLEDIREVRVELQRELNIDGSIREGLQVQVVVQRTVHPPSECEEQRTSLDLAHRIAQRARNAASSPGLARTKVLPHSGQGVVVELRASDGALVAMRAPK